jgi:hypothetical protein
MHGIVHGAMREVAEAYSGHYLIETNGHYILSAVTVPTGEPDRTGWIDSSDTP